MVSTSALLDTVHDSSLAYSGTRTNKNFSNLFLMKSLKVGSGAMLYARPN